MKVDNALYVSLLRFGSEHFYQFPSVIRHNSPSIPQYQTSRPLSQKHNGPRLFFKSGDVHGKIVLDGLTANMIKRTKWKLLAVHTLAENIRLVRERFTPFNVSVNSPYIGSERCWGVNAIAATSSQVNSERLKYTQ